MALRRLLGRALDRPARELEFTRLPCPCCDEPHGRPALADAPFPLHFSLSHGGEWVLIGTAGKPLGVDVEPEPRPDALSDLIGVLHPAEQAELAESAESAEGASDDGSAAQGFARLWTRKEAYLKGLGTGLGRALDLDYFGTRTPVLRPPGWTVANVGAAHLADAPLHAAAYAVESPAVEAAVHRLPLEFIR